MRNVAGRAMQERRDDVVVVGSGIGGLVTALSLAPRSVTLITKTPELHSGSSLWAQGGIAAAVGPDDSPQAHAADTLNAGAGLSDPVRTLELAEEGAASLAWLENEGIAFDRDLHGALELAKEAAHRVPRVAHAGGDTTGYVLVKSLAERVQSSATINVVANTFAVDVVVDKGRVQGLVAFNEVNGWVFYRAPNVVLATGGVGMAWWRTTNPSEATGDGLAMAARAGAKLTNLEFVQFHPTALAVESKDGASLPLLTEALRGAGATLLDEQGRRFMLCEHPLAELAPRDVVARSIEKRTGAGEGVFLDLRPVLAGVHGRSFPNAVQTAHDAGFDPYGEALPVTPAAHYHMGGVEIDDVGRTSIDGLWACGEVASTGIHGANRLASNSLLEALVYARRVGRELRDAPLVPESENGGPPAVPHVPAEVDIAALSDDVTSARRLMSRYVGIVRTGKDLDCAYDRLAAIGRRIGAMSRDGGSSGLSTIEGIKCWGEARNLVLVARLITFAALQREESRGAHYRDDYPEARPEWRRQQSLTVSTLAEAH